MKKRKNKLQPITADLINEMRRRGQYTEAGELLQAHYIDLKKVKKDVLSDLMKIDRRLRKHFDICMTIGCHRESYKGVYCDRCKETQYKAMKAYRERKK